jgi:hypothetical protein
MKSFDYYLLVCNMYLAQAMDSKWSILLAILAHLVLAILEIRKEIRKNNVDNTGQTIVK